MRMAAEVIRLRLAGSTLQDALADVSDQFRKAESVIGEAFAAHKSDGFTLLRLERALGSDSHVWTPEERSKLEDMFGKEPWFIAPEKSSNKPA